MGAPNHVPIHSAKRPVFELKGAEHRREQNLDEDERVGVLLQHRCPGALGGLPIVVDGPRAEARSGDAHRVSPSRQRPRQDVRADLVPEVVAYDQGVAPVAAGEQPQGLCPVALGIGAAEPHSVAIVHLAAPPSITVVIVHDYHQTLCRQCGDNFIEDVKKSTAGGIGERTDIFLANWRVSGKSLQRVGETNTIESHSSDICCNLLR
mmetsp:Transcript_49591/g.153098  ORF Transcript_49591/g.153098 Transcript_49591/m.153098 type:complete len:207 (-) Transcript_49591:266-886(-)